MIQTDLYSFNYKKGSLLPWCKKCGAEHFYRAGKNKENIQRYKCKKCGFRFVWTSDLPRRNFFSNVISFATELYATAGISLRTISRKFKEHFDIKISHEGIRKWILAAKNTILPRKIVNSTTWHADETYIKIKGQGYWLWIVFCANTKQVLSWHISKGRFFEDAKLVLQKAKQIAGIPDKIITDGLYQYGAASKKVFHWKHHERKQRHIIDSGIGKNALIERVNREVKRRIKWFSTFQSLEGANTFFSLFFHHLNRIKLNSQELT